MSQPPSFLTLELEEENVLNDIGEIVQAMDRIRVEQSLRNEVTEEAKEEYLHLTFRLSSGMQVLSDDTLADFYQIVVDKMDEKPSLLGYDYAQEELWKEYDPLFSASLDEIVIQTLGDSFRGLQDKHHFFNGIKYLASSKGDEVQNSILPFLYPCNKYSMDAFKKEFKKVFGRKFLDFVKGNSIHLSVLDLETARRFGFRSIHAEMGQSEYEASSQDYNIKILSTENGTHDVEIPTRAKKEPYLPNYHPIMEELAQCPLPEEVEQNLVWFEGNHHTQGEEFRSALLDGGIDRKGFGAVNQFNRDEEALSLYDFGESGPYRKVSQLVCHCGQRAALTLVSPTIKDNDAFSSRIQKMMQTENKLQKPELEELRTFTGAIYLHLSRFKQSEKIEEYIITK